MNPNRMGFFAALSFILGFLVCLYFYPRNVPQVGKGEVVCRCEIGKIECGWDVAAPHVTIVQPPKE